MLFKDLLDGFIDLFYPPRCLVCGVWKKEWLCEDCINNIDDSSLPFCCYCMKEFMDIPDICSECNSSNFGCSLGYYEGVLREAICKFKYEKKIILGQKLGELMSRKFLIFFRPSSINIILPVPIHPVRMQVRGFNQAEILIRVLSSKCSIEYSFDFLQRVRDTYSQVKLPYDKREENVRDAFEIIDKDFSLRGKNILLIDDVFTTGSTIRECIRVLSKTGVNRVFTMFLARSWKTNF